MKRPTDPPEDLIAAKEAAELYSVPYPTLRNWWTRGKIEKWQRERDGKVYVRRSDVERMTSIRRVHPDTPALSIDSLRPA